MTHKQRMLAAIHGKPTDAIPWAPRLDLWYRANRRAGTLPAPYQNASLAEISEGLNAGFHAVIPDFRDLRSMEDDVHRALGVYNHRTMPYATVLRNVRWEAVEDGDKTIVRYETPVGSIRTTTIYDESMKRAGITVTHVAEHAIQDAKDFETVAYIFENAEVVPCPEQYDDFAHKIGDTGIAVSFVNFSASPMQYIQRDLIPLDRFYLSTYDCPDQIERCAEAVGGYYNRIFQVVADCPAEVFFYGANYDATVTFPPFFERHISPWLSRFAKILHAKGAKLLTHADGENDGLLDLYLRSRIDVADSICPKPMTRLTLRQVRDVFGKDVTIWGGIPSVSLLESSMSDYEFEAYLDQIFDDIGYADHLILGISDTTPPAAKFDRLKRIRQLIDQFGPIA